MAHFENNATIEHFHDDRDLLEMLDVFSDNDGCYYEHVIDNTGIDSFDVYVDGVYWGSYRLNDIAEQAVRYVFYDRPDLFPVFMQRGGYWENGGNMTPEIAMAIITEA